MKKIIALATLVCALLFAVPAQAAKPQVIVFGTMQETQACLMVARHPDGTITVAEDIISCDPPQRSVMFRWLCLANGHMDGNRWDYFSTEMKVTHRDSDWIENFYAHQVVITVKGKTVEITAK